MTMEFRNACSEDVECIVEIILGAQRRLAASGIDQWQNGYPNRPRVEEDIARGYGRVLLVDGEVVAYGALTYDGERAYEGLQGGSWLSHGGDYLTVHRLCVVDSAVGCGLGRRFMLEAEGEARLRVASVRVDTHPDNRVMRGLIASLGYTYCGTVVYESLRLAYEKIL
jgi:GNAT superfamily N-acetyltransferase